jgi:hypothetical protein
MYPIVEAVWQNDHLEPLEEIKTGKNISYLVTVIDHNQSEDQKAEPNRGYSFEKSQEILKNYTGMLSDAVIDERELAR